MAQKKQVLTSLNWVVRPLLKWYDHHARILPWRENTASYRVWVSEIMLQQTRVDTVIPYFERFLNALPTVEDLAAAPEDRLLKLWEGLGYYNRVRNLQKAAQVIVDEYDGVFPDDPQVLRKLPGIGEYTAGAIASICFDKPVAAVDGNVMRVVARLTDDGRDITKPVFRNDVAVKLQSVYPKSRCGDFTQSLMELGALVCLPNGAPLCGECPLAKKCMAWESGTQNQLPVKKSAKARRLEARTVLLLECGGGIALRKRPDKGLLAGMWEFPNFEGKLNLRSIKAILKEWGVGYSLVKAAGNAKHVFSHIEWDMTVYRVRCEDRVRMFYWQQKERIDVSLPTAFSQLLPLLNT